jgi:hypothetical protein
MAYSEKKYNIEASATTALIVLLVFLLLWFLKLHVPDPPINERGGQNGDGDGGIELAYAPIASDNPSVSPNTQPETPEVPVEETVTDVEEPTEAPVDNGQNVITNNASTDAIKVSNNTSSTKVTTNTPKTEDKPKVTKPKPKVNTGDLFGDGDDDGGGDPNGNSNIGNGGSGSGEGGTSTGHDFGKNGWNWAKSPKTDKKSTKNGEIVFSVEIDDNGKVTNVVAKSYTVDYELMQAYQEECYKLKFVRKNDSNPVAAKTKGYITFTFKAR